VAYKHDVDSVIGCAICGMDPATDTFLVNMAAAAVLSGPLIFRTQVVATFRRVRARLRGQDVGATCELPHSDEAP